MELKVVTDKMISEAMTDGYAVAYGKTYDHSAKFQQYGFTLKKIDNKWIWLRSVLFDKFQFWNKAVEGFGQGIECFYIKDLTQISQAIEESKEIKTVVKRPDIESHKLDGSVVEVKKWYANILKEKNNTQYAFRNLKILKVKQETPRAILADVEFFSGISSSCGCCGLALSNDISRATGIGPICATKIGLPRPTMETAKEIVKELESLSKAQGVFKDVWIPKSQIKETLTLTQIAV